MSSESPQQNEARRPGADPRLAARREPVAPVVLAGMIAGAAGVALAIVGVLWWAVSNKFMPGPLVVLIVGAGGIVFYVVTNRQRLRELTRQRAARQTVNSASFAFFVLGIIVLINIIGARHHWRHDFTENKQFSLSEQTLKILRGLDKTVELIAFVSPDYYNADEIRSRLREYDIASAKTKVLIYDPQTNIDKAKEFDVRFDGTIFVKCGDKREEVTGGSEEQITSAILAVTKGEKTKVYFLSGHGEKRIDSYADDGLADLKANLENQQYEVKDLVLLKEKQPKVPADCAVLCIIGPTQPLAKQEIEAIKKYLDQGGKLLVALEPPPAPDLHEILEPYGVKPLSGVVIDPQVNFFGNAGIPLVVQPEEHEVTRKLQGLFFPGVRALEIEESEPEEPPYPGGPPPTPTKKADELLMSSDGAWVETNLKPGTQPKKDAGERSGRLCFAAAVDLSKKKKPPTPPGMPPPEEEEEGPGTRIVVVGDSDFLTRNITSISPAGLFFGLKAIAWLAKEEKLVSIPAKERTERRMVLSGGQLKLAVIITFVIPILILLAGIGVWVTRRGG